jgi:hypothetical protein
MNTTSVFLNLDVPRYKQNHDAGVRRKLCEGLAFFLGDFLVAARSLASWKCFSIAIRTQ